MKVEVKADRVRWMDETGARVKAYRGATVDMPDDVAVGFCDCGDVVVVDAPKVKKKTKATKGTS